MSRDAWLVPAAVVGPLAWFADLVISFGVAPAPHRAPDAAALLAISGAAFAFAAAGGLVSWRALRAGEQRRFIARAGVALSMLAMLLVVATALPTLLLTPGGEP